MQDIRRGNKNQRREQRGQYGFSYPFGGVHDKTPFHIV
jgi:hypothetical protein